MLGIVADYVNVREDAFRLILSILAGYPLAFVHRTFLFNKPAFVQHSYFTFVGVLLYLFNCGIQIYHSLVSIGIAYLIVTFLPGTILSVFFAHFCFLGHLLIGYWFAESSTYDITWTTPFCIMTLRYIGLVMDIYDGHQTTTDENAARTARARRNNADFVGDTAISERPGLLEIAAFGLFFAGTLVGPQFSLARFRAFVNGQFLDKNSEVRQSSWMASIQRFAAGIFYVVIHSWGTLWVPDSYLNSKEFMHLPFFWKVVWNTIWFRAVMYRYVLCWLLTEGVTILIGIAYNGTDENGDDRWDGVRDIHIVKFELGSDYQSVIDSFNCGTNNFAKNHIFKRLRWLGNKFVSHFATLFYLALWHGYHLGYFMLFIHEFACMAAQEQLYEFIERGPPAVRQLLSRWWMRPLCWLFGRVAITTSMAFAFLTFGLVKKEIWIAPMIAMYFYGYVLYIVLWPALFYLVLRPMIIREGRRD
ncbi:hypothetical protein GPALN_004978 [Globodera pallida]|nr:hypothetical protein GPALN_004978 [Globodera pallida]